MEYVTQFVSAILPSIVVGIFMAFWNKEQKARDAREEEANAARLRSERLRLKLLVATAQLSYATTMAMKRGSTNGEVEPAVKQYEIAMEDFREFEREQLAKVSIDI